MSQLQTPEELMGILEKILANKKASAEALKDPSKVLIKFGVRVADPELTNETFFKTVPRIRAHFVAGAAGKPHSLLACESVKCIACKAGLMTGGAALIAAAIAGFPEDGAAVAAVAEFCGLSVDTVMTVFRAVIRLSGGSLSAAVSALCDAMGAC